jgi:peroxiredoxin
VAKLGSRSSTWEAVEAFGLPSWLAGPARLALPVVELLVAAALIPASSAAPAGWLALGLLAVFSAVVGFSLARGRRPACHCFGQISAAPVGWRTLGRNGVLGVLAGFVAVAGWPDGGASLGGVGSARAATAVVIAILAAAVAGAAGLVMLLLGRYGQVLRRLDQLEGSAGVGGVVGDGARAGLAVGTAAPEFALPGVDGGTVSLAGLRAAGRPVLLVFSDPDCGPCQSLLPDLAVWQTRAAGRFVTALVSSGSVAANQAKVREHELLNVAVQGDREVATAYRYAGTPSAVLVTAAGQIGSTVVAGPGAIRSLVAALLNQVPGAQPGVGGQPAQAGEGQGVPVGQPVPAVSLPDLDGRQFDLAARRARPCLVLFWNPACGFCQQALPDLKARERGTIDLVFVSTGSATENREMDLSSPVLLDPSFATARAFGATGTPSAILVSAGGLVASALAVGAPAVLSLADTDPVSVPGLSVPGLTGPGLTGPGLTGPGLDGG